MTIIAPNLVLFGLVILAAALVVAVVRTSHTDRASIAVARRECPACKEWMRRDASICPHCRTPSEPWSYSNGRWWIVRNDATYYLDETSQAWVRVDPASPPGA